MSIQIDVPYFKKCSYFHFTPFNTCSASWYVCTFIFMYLQLSGQEYGLYSQTT